MDGNARILRSLQSCLSIKENFAVLDQYLKKLTKDSSLFSKVKALKEILLYLTILKPVKNEQMLTRGHMPFDEAYEIYNSYFPVMGFSLQEKQEFQKSLLHPKYGLRVIVFTSNNNRRYIILSPNDIDLELFLMTLIDDNKLKQSDTSEHENATFVRKVINSMDTEWDRKCQFALLALNRSRRELEDLTVDPGVVTRNSDCISQILTEIDNAKIEAEDMINMRLDSRMKKIKGELTEKELLYLQKKDRWSNGNNTTNDLILNLTPENVTQHSRIVTTTRKGSSTPTKISKIIGKLEHLQSQISSLKLRLNEAESFDENNK